MGLSGSGSKGLRVQRSKEMLFLTCQLRQTFYPGNISVNFAISKKTNDCKMLFIENACSSIKNAALLYFIPDILLRTLTNGTSDRLFHERCVMPFHFVSVCPMFVSCFNNVCFMLAQNILKRT